MPETVTLHPSSDGDLADALDHHWESETHVYLAPGRYEWGHSITTSGVSDAKLIGDPDAPGSVVIEATAGDGGAELKNHFGTDIEIGGFTAVCSRDGGDLGFNMMVEGEGRVAHVHDIRWTGFSPNPPRGDQVQKCRIQPNDPDGVVRIERIVSDGATERGGHGDGYGLGIYDYNQAGVVEWRDVDVRNENGDGPAYTGQHGIHEMKRWYAENNEMSQCRIAGSSSIEDAVLVFDPHDDHPDNVGEMAAASTLFFDLQSDQRVDSGDYGARAENVDIVHRPTGTLGFPVKINSGSNDVVLEDVRIRLDGPTDNPAVLAMAPGQSGDPGGGRGFFGPPGSPERVTLDDVSITGDAAPSDGAVWLLGREGCRIDVCSSLDAEPLRLSHGASTARRGVRTSGCTPATVRYPPNIPWRRE